jgi:hypothetical protein
MIVFMNTEGLWVHQELVFIEQNIGMADQLMMANIKWK